MTRLIGIILFISAFSINAKNTDPNQCLGVYQQVIDCTNTKELEIIKQYPDLMSREGKKLTLRAIKGQNEAKVLINDEVHYTLIKYLPEQHISLISVEGYEYTDAYIYHHLYGIYVQVYGDIVISNDSKTMIAFNIDLDSGFSPNTIALFSLGDWPELRTLYNPTSFGVTEAKFLSNKRISVKTLYYSNVPPYQAITGICYLSQVNSIWQFDDLSCYQQPVE